MLRVILLTGPRSKPPRRNSTTLNLLGSLGRSNDTLRYCVRPNAGRIEPGQDFNVSGTYCSGSYVTQRLTFSRGQSFYRR